MLNTAHSVLVVEAKGRSRNKVSEQTTNGEITAAEGRCEVTLAVHSLWKSLDR